MAGAQSIVLATPGFLLLIGVEFLVGCRRGRSTDRLSDALNRIRRHAAGGRADPRARGARLGVFPQIRALGLAPTTGVNRLRR